MLATSKQIAEDLDNNDPLREYRSQFYIPSGKTRKEQLYFTGNSLGLQPKSVRTYIQQELDDWKNFGVEGHFHSKNPWFSYHHFFEKEELLEIFQHIQRLLQKFYMNSLFNL